MSRKPKKPKVIEMSVPEWCPSNAIIHIDLVGGDPQGRAWVDGVGEVAVDALLGSDPNTENAWAITEYNSVNLDALGYNGRAALIGQALTKVLSGSTVVIDFVNDNTEDTSVPAFGVCSADGVSCITFEIDENAKVLRGAAYTGSFFEEQPLTHTVFTSVTNRMAVTLTPTRGEAAECGSSVLEKVLTSAEFPTTGESPMVASFVDAVAIGAASIARITIYDALPDTSGLSALSAV
jgi:hypothetical protein